MKKIFIWSGGIIVFMLILLFSLPYFFKDEIVKAVKNDLNRNLKAEVDFGDVQVGLWKTFPDLYVGIKDISVVHTDSVFRDIPLAQIGELGLVLDLKDLFSGKKNVKNIRMKDASFLIRVTHDGKANYDIVKNGETQEEDTETGSLTMHIQNYEIENLKLLYDDASMGLRAYLSGLRHAGNAEIQADDYLLTGKTSVDTVDVVFDNVRYLRNARMELTDTIGLENDFSKFVFRNITGKINSLPVRVDGEIEMKPNEDMAIQLRFGTEKSGLKELLSLVPQAYIPAMPEMDISGRALFSGSVEGIYNEQHYPSYHLKLDVDRGRVKGKDLPESIDGIQVLARVDFPGGPDLDATVVDIPSMQFSVAGNPVKGRLKVTQPMTDPYVNTAFKSNLELSHFKKAVPLKNIRELKGKLKADFYVKGRVSDMEKQRTDRIDAGGYLNLKDFAFASDSIPLPVQIPEAETHFTPRAWKLDKLFLKAGKSDFDMQGEAYNYLGYFTGKDSTLTARFISKSNKIDLNELMSATGSQEEVQSQDTVSLQAFKIPKGIDFSMDATAGEVVYEDLHLKNVKAKLDVKDQKAILKSVMARAFGGQMGLEGEYDSSTEKPSTALKLNMQKMQLDETARHLTYFKTYAPILKYIKGLFGMQMQLNVRLDEHMQPVLSTTDASGIIEATGLRPEKASFFSKAGQVLKLKALENPRIDKARAQYRINDGNLFIKPFDFKVNGMPSRLSGRVTLDRKLDLDWNLEIPVERLGARAHAWLQSISGELNKWGIKAGEIKILYVNLKITGDIMHPQIKPVFKKGAGMQGLTETVKETVKQEIKQVTDTIKEALDEKARALIAEAERKGDLLIAEAEKTAEKIKREADKKAQQLIREAGNNPIAKFAAEKAAGKIRKEADKKAKQILEKAKQTKQRLVEEARKKAEELRQKELVK